MVAPVGSFKPNRFGLYDMAGNVTQWVQDKYRVDMVTPEELKETPSYAETKAEDGEDYYVSRGSSWQSHGSSLKSSDIGRAPVTYHPDLGGFRLVLVVKSQPRSATP
jgi:formylglycine-generating enzyme required for sulfatase activity